MLLLFLKRGRGNLISVIDRYVRFEQIGTQGLTSQLCVTGSKQLKCLVHAMPSASWGFDLVAKHRLLSLYKLLLVLMLVLTQAILTLLLFL